MFVATVEREISERRKVSERVVSEKAVSEREVGEKEVSRKRRQPKEKSGRPVFAPVEGTVQLGVYRKFTVAVRPT